MERQLGTQLVRRTQRGVHPTEAGRLLAGHAEAILGRLALAEAQVAELSGLRRGRVRLGSFFTALVYLSAEAAGALEALHPDLFRAQPDVIVDELVDRRTAFRRLAAGELDVAIVFEHEQEPDPAPEDVELIPLFDDPPRVLLPASDPLARRASLSAADLAGHTWIRAHHGSAARLVDRVLHAAGIDPPILPAGHGDEPVEAQAFIAAGRGVTIAHDLNVLIDPHQIAAVPLAGGRPVRRVQAAIMSGQRAPAPLAVVEALREVGARRAARLSAAGELRVAAEDQVPAVLGAPRRAVALGALAVALEARVQEADARLVSVALEGDLDLARVVGIGVGHPGRADLPGEHEPPRRLPREHAPPVAAEAMRADLEAHAALAGLDPDVLELLLRPGVLGRPPLAEPLREAGERALGRRRDGDGGTYVEAHDPRSIKPLALFVRRIAHSVRASFAAPSRATRRRPVPAIGSVTPPRHPTHKSWDVVVQR